MKGERMMGSMRICDNCDKPIKDGEKTKPYKSTFGDEVLCDYEDVCPECEQRIRDLADNSFKPARKSRKPKEQKTTE